MWKKISASFLVAVIQQSAFCEPADELEATFERFNHRATIRVLKRHCGPQSIIATDIKLEDIKSLAICSCILDRMRLYDTVLLGTIHIMKTYDRLNEEYPKSLICLQEKMNKWNKMIYQNARDGAGTDSIGCDVASGVKQYLSCSENFAKHCTDSMFEEFHTFECFEVEKLKNDYEFIENPTG